MCRWLMLTLLLALATSTARAEPIEPGDVYVIDGDTIEVNHVQPNDRLASTTQRPGDRIARRNAGSGSRPPSVSSNATFEPGRLRD